MRQVSLFLAALFCLALVGQQSASADEVKEAKDKSEEWKEGSVWKGTSKTTHPDGSENSRDVTAVVTKRDGNSFEARFEMNDGKVFLEWDGDVDVAGMMKFTITKIAKVPDEFKNAEWFSNLVGAKGSGTMDGKSVTLKYVRPQPNNPKGVPNRYTIKLKGKE